MKRTGLLVLGIAVAVNISGCASVAKEVIKQVISENDVENEETEDEEEEDFLEDSQDNHQEDSGQEESRSSSQGSFSGGYDQFIKDELEPRLGTGKNNEFSYGFERIDYEGSNGFFASPMMASLTNGVVSTYRRDLNKDGRDELLVIYIEGSRQSSDGRNHFCLDIYGEEDNRITQLGKISFDDCFSGYNGEEYLFGLKDMGDKRLIYTGGTGHVWTWADGSNPEIHLYQMEDNGMKEIYHVFDSGSGDYWVERWRSELQGYGFDLTNPDWNECNMAGESGFEVLAYGECYTEDRGSGSFNYHGEYQQYWLDNGVIIGGIYGSDSLMVMQMNQSMRAYSGGGQSVYSGGNTYSANTGAGAGYTGENGGSSGYNNTGDYILPNSSSTYLSRADLAGLSQEQLRLARNEIYARHGRKFKTKEIQDYFNRKSWYVGTIESDSFKDSYLNIYEKENIKLIQSMEK